jgi:hypothetical protein
VSVAFVVALVLRIRSYSRQESVSTETTTTVEPPIEQRQRTDVAAARGIAGRVDDVVSRKQHMFQILANASSPSAMTTPLPATTAPPTLVAPKPPGRTLLVVPSTKSSNASVSTGSTARSSTPSGGSDRRNREVAKDPNSDTTPPQLVSIEFVPPQVQDGQDATIVIVATDELSGVRGVSGTITSPTGKALQGFAEQREGDADRYVGRVHIPKDAEAGPWHVNFLSLSDNASNSVMLNWAQGTIPRSAVLQVISSGSDSTPPTLKSVSLERRAIHAGEKDVVLVEAEDDKSGVNLVSVTFVSPAKRARIGASCGHGGGDLWQCELLVPACVDCGDWQLEQVTLQDKANNLANVRTDNPLVRAVQLNIAGDNCDSNAPVMQGLVLSTNDLVIGREGATLTVTVTAFDDGCGISGISGQYGGPGAGSGGFFPMQSTGDPNTFVGRIQFNPLAPRGTWRILSIQLTDRARNLRIYDASDPMMRNGIFQVR